MEATQEQLDEWREVMRRVCAGSIEVQQAVATHNRARLDLLLRSLGGAAARSVAQMDQAGAQPRCSAELPGDGTYDTPANRRYLEALRQAMYAAREVDAERTGAGTPAADVVQMLMSNVIREIYGPPVAEGTLFPSEPAPPL